MTNEDIQKIYDYSESKYEMIKKFGIRPNQNGYNLDVNLLKILSQIGINDRSQISKEYLKNHRIEVQKRDYEKEPKCCEVCGKPLPFERRLSKCCNQSCASTLGNLKRGGHSKKTREKLSKSMKQYYKSLNKLFLYEKIYIVKKYYDHRISFDLIKEQYPSIIKVCEICNKEYIPNIAKSGKKLSATKCCSDECHHKLVSLKSKECRAKEIANGTFQGWKSRNIISYPEKFWTTVLDNNNIKYEREYKVSHPGSSQYYFLDFYIEINNRKIDLEIDGKQHKCEDRKEHDKIRDKYLISEGFEVYRIPWNEINTEKGSNKMKEKIDKFLEFIK